MGEEEVSQEKAQTQILATESQNIAAFKIKGRVKRSPRAKVVCAGRGADR